MGASSVFPKKDPGVLDLLGSSLSCDATGLTSPYGCLRLRLAERFRVNRLHPIAIWSSSPTCSAKTTFLIHVFLETASFFDEI